METPGILRYGRDALLKLQEADLGAREERWAKFVTELPHDVVEELRDMRVPADEPVPFRRRAKYSERKSRIKAKREALHALSINALDRDGEEDDENCHRDSPESTPWHTVSGNNGTSHHSKWSWNSRAYHNAEALQVESFQPPAFLVEGEPDFDSGDPQDGWEYLRRVKYEAARCPKVVVAEIDPMKLTSEQTAYMPEIPEILACPPDLLPSSEWETQFLEDFLSLRTTLLATRLSRKYEHDRLPSLRNQAAWEMRCFGFITSAKQGVSTDTDAFRSETIEIPRADFDEDMVLAESGDAVVSAVSDSTLPSTESDSIMIPVKPKEPVHLARADIERGFDAGESKPSSSNHEKDTLLSLVEVAERQLDQILDSESPDVELAEVNYIIDLQSLSAPLPGFDDLAGSFNASEYLISGEPTDTHGVIEDEMDLRAYPFTHEPEDELASNVYSLDVLDSITPDNRILEMSTSDINLPMQRLTVNQCEERHHAGGDGHIVDSSFLAVDPMAQTSDLETVSDVTMSESFSTSFLQSETHSSKLKALPEELMEKQSNDVQAESEAVSLIDPFNRFSDVLGIEPHGVSPELNKTSADRGQPLDHYNIEGSCSDLNIHFEHLSLGPTAGQYSQELSSELDLTLESLCGLEFAECEEAQIPDSDFIDSVVGLEIFISGNVVADDRFHDIDESDGNDTFAMEPSVEELFVKVFHLCGVSRLPFIRLLLRLDEISRATLLRYHASWLETVDGVPLDRALWLLALSAVVDVPLDAQTSAAFRSVLRHCARVRAERDSTEAEDLHILNALITVSGLYFGQAEKQPMRREIVCDTALDQSWLASEV